MSLRARVKRDLVGDKIPCGKKKKLKRNSDTSREERKCLCGQEQKRKV